MPRPVAALFGKGATVTDTTYTTYMQRRPVPPSATSSRGARDLVRLGEYLLAAMRLDGALRCFDAAIARDGGDVRAQCGRGRTLYRMRRPREALRSFEQGLRLGADPVHIAEECWMCAMLAGKFAAAWHIGDLILARRRRADLNRHDQPFHLRHVWDGSALAGRDVLVRCYHGLGDTIQFIRFAPLVKRVARSVTVQAVPALHGLLAGCAGIDRLVSLGYSEPDPPFDVDIELMEVPHALRTTERTIPAEIPYVRVPRRRPMPALRHDPRLRVGLVWRAGDWDGRRSVPLSQLAPLGGMAGIALTNLQRGPGLAELNCPAVPAFADGPGAWTDDLVDTAAMVATLDLVIAVDTMVAHLAGALGVEVWMLLHSSADWRWMLDRDDTPWYPTMRLFRQDSPGEWEPVVEAVANRLRARAAAHRRAPADAQ